MRRLLTILITGAVLAPLAACGAEPERGPAPSPSAPSAPAPSPPGPSAPAPTDPAPTGNPSPPDAGPARPPATTAPRPTPSRPPATPAEPPPPDSGELPGGLPFGDRKLTGVVERTGPCAALRVGTGLWGLTGQPVAGLSPGDRVTVEGQVTTTEPACGGRQGTARTVVVRRVTPA
jgi:hypothetical protein